MTEDRILYALGTFHGAEYNSHANVAFYQVGNLRLGLSPAGHSDKRKFKEGVTLLCMFSDRKYVGITLESMAEVTEMSEGKPTEFGETRIQGGSRYGWKPPTEEVQIVDMEVIESAIAKKKKEREAHLSQLRG